MVAALLPAVCWAVSLSSFAGAEAAAASAPPEGPLARSISQALSFGAEVLTDVSTVLGRPELAAALPALLQQHGLLLWRGEHSLTPAQQVALARLLPHDATAAAEEHGPQGVDGADAEEYRRWRLPGQAEVLLQGEGEVRGHHGLSGWLSSGKPVREWHTDGLYEQQRPSAVTSMYSISTMAVGGDTLFASGRDVWRHMPQELQQLATQLTAEYTRVPAQMHPSGCRALTSVEAEANSKGAGSNLGQLYQAAQARPKRASVRHPLVWGDGGVPALQVSPMWVHRLLFANGSAMPADDAQLLLQRCLCPVVDDAAATYRHRWRPGDLVVWSNRWLLHSATPNSDLPADGLRLLHRVRLLGHTKPEYWAAAEEPAVCTDS